VTSPPTKPDPVRDNNSNRNGHDGYDRSNNNRDDNHKRNH
jgi:hypothetical protein